jgi:hypothetical protein
MEFLFSTHVSFPASSKIVQRGEGGVAPTTAAVGKKALVERQTEIDMVKSLQ